LNHNQPYVYCKPEQFLQSNNASQLTSSGDRAVYAGSCNQIRLESTGNVL